MKKYIVLIICLNYFALNGFSQDKYKLPTKEKFNEYWYHQGAEISSYELIQHRYTEKRKGYVVKIFVTEPFDKIKQVKADNAKDNKNAISILKLNHVKKFNTGIYQYSIMNSIFTPIKSDNLLPLKITTSVQEWCGQVYLQMNLKENQYHLKSFSYFESEGDIKKDFDVQLTEDGLWNMIRINPNKLPHGEKIIVPSINYLRLMHKELKGYKGVFELIKKENNTIYSIELKDLKRKMLITFENKFPFKIIEWEESYPGLKYMKKGKLVKTSAKIHKTIHSFYWSKNNNKDSVLRTKLGLNDLLKN